MAKENVPATAAQTGALASVLGGLAPAKYADEKSFDDFASGGQWLPRLQLYGSNTDFAKEGKIPMGTYGVVSGKDQLIPLGAEVDCLVLSWRPKAMQISDGEVLTNFNPQSNLFKDIAARSEISDSGCMFGPEFLIWLPNHKKYATFMMASKSSRREAPNLKSILESQKEGKLPAATLKVTLISGKKYKWHNPVITRCSTPFELPTDIDELKKIVEDFNNPKESDVEEVKKEETTQRAR